jgi:hypothetical protein
MTIGEQHGKRHPYFHAVLVLAIIFTTALTAAGLSGYQTGKHKFELRLASHKKVEGWERAAGPGPGNTPVWISPEVALTNGDVARAWPDRAGENKPCVGVLFTEEGTLKMARLTKSHIGEFLAVILDGRVTRAPRIREEITGGRALIEGSYFTEEEAKLIAKGILSGSTFAQSAVESSVPTNSVIRRMPAERIGDHNQSAGIVVGVIEPAGRRIVAYGSRSKGDKRPMDGDTIFEIGSITKVFTSLLLAQRVSGIAEPVTEWFGHKESPVDRAVFDNYIGQYQIGPGAFSP